MTTRATSTPAHTHTHTRAAHTHTHTHTYAHIHAYTRVTHTHTYRVIEHANDSEIVVHPAETPLTVELPTFRVDAQCQEVRSVILALCEQHPEHGSESGPWLLHDHFRGQGKYGVAFHGVVDEAGND